MTSKILFIIISFSIAFSVRAGEIQDEYFKRKDVGDYKILNDYDIVEIGMERTGCLGVCPSYTVRIRSDGSIIYSGGKYAKFQGVKKGKINDIGLSNLLDFVKKSDYLYMRDEYSSKITDNSSTYTYIKFDGKVTTHPVAHKFH